MKIDTDEIRNVDCKKIWKSFRGEEVAPDGSTILLEADIAILVSHALELCNAYDAKCVEVDTLHQDIEGLNKHLHCFYSQNHPYRINKVFGISKDGTCYSLMIKKLYGDNDGLMVEVDLPMYADVQGILAKLEECKKQSLDLAQRLYKSTGLCGPIDDWIKRDMEQNNRADAQKEKEK